MSAFVDGRSLSLPERVAAAGGIEKWNASQPEHSALLTMVSRMCTAQTTEEALVQVNSLISLGDAHYLFAYLYMRMLASRSPELCYATILREPAKLLPVMYTPTVGEACQKFGRLPMFSRGCYVKISDKGRIKDVLSEYAEAELEKDAGGRPLCDCIVFSDGGRILGLGDLGTFGMGIPVGKLDLYTVCGGLNPRRTIPCIIDAGVGESSKNTARLDIRNDPLYTGMLRDRVTKRSAAGTIVNAAYYGEGNVIEEFMTAAADLFGKHCLLQFEDFNSNDAFPLLAEYREKFLCYNDDIQGTAAVTVAGILGAIKLKNPSETDLIGALRRETYLFHGAGSANLGCAQLLVNEGNVSPSRLHMTNSRGLIWRSEDGRDGTFRNQEQRAFAHVGALSYDSKDLVKVVKHLQPSCIVGAVGVRPNCFTKEVIEEMVAANSETVGRGKSMQLECLERPIVFALSNPKTQAEITAEDAYKWSDGQVIYGSGTKMDPCEVSGRIHHPGQVNNVYVFPGMSFGCVACKAKSIPDRLFMVAAEAVANSLSEEDLELDRVIPARDRLREVALNVATATVLEAQGLGLASETLGETSEAVKEVLRGRMWFPAP